MRKKSNIELIKVLQQELDKIDKERFKGAGLCWLIYEMHAVKKLSDKEYMRLSRMIENNDPRPKTRTKLYQRIGYYFPMGQKAPRRRYLELLLIKQRRKH